MKITRSRCEIASRLTEDDYANWSYEGALALADFLERREEDFGAEEEFDRVAIRSEFHEYDQEGLVNDYGYFIDQEDLAQLGSIEDQAEAIYDSLQYHTTVLEVGNGRYIVQTF